MDLGEQMVWAANEMVRRGLTVHTAGNVSARTEDGTGFLITPSSVPYSAIQPQDALR